MINLDEIDENFRFRVLIESPFHVPNNKEATQNNINYGYLCVKDSLNRGEDPFASHLTALTKVLDDHNPEERKRGIEAGLNWGNYAHFTAVYTDLGISEGMELGIERAEKQGRKVVYRSILKK